MSSDCYFCDEPVIVEDFVPAHDPFDPTCDKRDRPGACLHAAHDSCLTIAAERANDRSVKDFYGGSAPQTIAEQYDAAARQRRDHDKETK